MKKFILAGDHKSLIDFRSQGSLNYHYVDRIIRFAYDPFWGSQQSLNYRFAVFVYFPGTPSESKLSSELNSLGLPSVIPLGVVL
jgi:hypothetical protein